VDKYYPVRPICILAVSFQVHQADHPKQDANDNYCQIYDPHRRLLPSEKQTKKGDPNCCAGERDAIRSIKYNVGIGEKFHRVCKNANPHARKMVFQVG
jgi:hypothetical protein